MSPDLRAALEHARAMARPGAHADGCGRRYPYTRTSGAGTLGGSWTRCTDSDPHPEHDWDLVLSNGHDEFRSPRRCEGVCDGCVTAAERALWRQLADEIEAYGARESHDEGQDSLI